jgi:hypothetical protein
MLLEGDELNREVKVSALINEGIVLGGGFQRGHEEGKVKKKAIVTGRKRGWYGGGVRRTSKNG